MTWMASLQSKADAVRDATSSLSTCTTATVVALRSLLQSDNNDGTSTKPTAAAARRPKTPSTNRSRAVTATGSDEGAGLNTKDRTKLATHVINVTLKSLTEATKNPVPATPSKKEQGRQSPTGRTLRRSLSTPLSPLQNRTVNRVATSPAVASKASRATTAVNSTLIAHCQPTVECARLAFACLRSLKGPVTADQTDFQIDVGATTLVSKLIVLGFHDQAGKELIALKHRLEKGKDSKVDSSQPCDLLNFGVLISPHSLSTVVACQTQALRLIAATKRPKDIEGALPHLRESCASSPVNTLLKLAASDKAAAAKAARQLATFSQMLLSLAPSVSSNDDTVALEPRLSVSPATAFEVQSLAFKMQLRWWKLAAHEGKIDDELLSSYSRCVRCFLRRSGTIDTPGYALLSQSFSSISDLYRAQGYQPKESSDAPIASIYASLGSAAHATHHFKDAHSWYLRIRALLKADGASSVRSCANSARILAASVRTPIIKDEDTTYMDEVSKTLSGPLSGTTQDVNDLLESALLARRSVASVLGSRDGTMSFSPNFTDTMQKFLTMFPRFILRWLGNPPGKDASAKHILQFDQRRQIVLQCVGQVLDGSMVVVKGQIQGQTPEFATIDEVLRDCGTLIENLCDASLSTAKTGQLSGYYVKISSLYFSLFSQLRMRKDASKADRKSMIHALSRSIDIVKDASRADKEAAQLSAKLEMMASVCKSMGRSEDAAKALRTICTNMVEDGVLSQIADALSHQPPRRAWGANDKTLALSRTLRSMAKLDNALNDWTFFLPETERAAVLEHLLQVATEEAETKPLQLHDMKVAAVLRILTADRYPIRRFRILLMLLFHNVGEEQSSRDITTLLEQTLRYIQKKDVAEDSGLVSYVSHLRNQHNSLLAMHSEPFDTASLKDCLSSWAAMIQSCSSEEEITAAIDDPDDFLTHLRALGQLAGLKGEGRLQLTIQELCVKVTQTCTKSGDDAAIVYQCQLISQYVEMGLFIQASGVLEDVKRLAGQQKLSPGAMVNFHLAQAGYLAGMDQTSEAMACLLKASDIHSTSVKAWSSSPSEATLIRSEASLALSNVALRKGDIQEALGCIRTSVRWLCSEWSALNGPSVDPPAKPEPTLAESVLGKPIVDTKPAVLGSRLWAWASPLVKSLIQISSVYAHIGMYQETWYFANCARRVAEGTQSPLFLSMVNAWLGFVCVRGGKAEEAASYLNTASEHLPTEPCAARVQLASRLGELYLSVGEVDRSEQHFAVAEETSRLLDGLTEPNEAAVEAKQPAVRTPAPTRARATTARAAAAPRAVRVTRARPAATPSAPVTTTKPAAQKRAAATKTSTKTALAKTAPSVPRDSYQASLLASVIVSRAMGYMYQQDWSAVVSILETIKDLPKLALASCQEKLIIASRLITSSMNDMAQDPVYSVVQDSTTSFPAVCHGGEKGSTARPSVSQSPPRKGRAVQTERKAVKERGVPAFMGSLKQAQEALLEAQACAMIAGDNAMLRRISTLLQSTVLALSAAAPPKDKAALRLDSTTVAVDLARNATWRREIQSLQLPSAAEHAQRALVATDPLTKKMAELSLTTDMSGFQNDFIELVPEKWNVISLSLSEHGRDLCITKYQAGHGPFILRLPLERANSRDADSEVFNFEHGREELLDIISLANETSHSAKNLSSKASKNEWWDKRQELDQRLEALLATIESTWFGGFKGIFSQHQRRPDLLARFQSNFHNILDRNLPSRSRAPRGKSATRPPAINLDPRILDLFIGLGDASDPDCEFDEVMNDLLYFVVDILQFHGERNAYDEIDFDGMVVETYDALRAYHQEANRSENGRREDGAHTILVLDSSLHAFPWESMPCLQGLPVSRVPSLECLRRLLTESRAASISSTGTRERPKGHYVSSKKGSYVLNPSSDLKNTQSYFEPAFSSSLDAWASHVDKKPEESVFEVALTSSDVFLYFGHGGGAQYIRAKTIRRLPKCRPVTFLMGCSSAALTEAGEFECYGQIWHYMMAGCPAVVGTLWDVTDRDIDRFAGRAFENWGLFPRGTFKEEEKLKSKSKSTNQGGSHDEEEGRLEHAGSVVEAVAAAREACRFKYLNAAAVVVYGIPAYLDDE